VAAPGRRVDSESVLKRKKVNIFCQKGSFCKKQASLVALRPIVASHLFMHHCIALPSEGDFEVNT